mgnify:CR=1 FL=1
MMVDPFSETDAAPSCSAAQSPLASGVAVCIAVVALFGAWVAPAAQAQSTPPLVQGPADLAGFSDGASSVADVDDDGNLDVLLAGQSRGASRSAALYLGNGDGTFSEASVGLPGVSSASTAIGDVNDDGDADLLITGETSSDFVSQTLVTELYLGNGDGTFTRANASLTGIDDGAAAIADVNNDGNDDLILTGNTGDDGDTASTILYLSNGDGTFNETSTSLTDVYESAVAVGDVDGDSNVDVFVTGAGGTGLFFGNGDGTFTQANATPSNLALLDGAASIADIDGDGNKDFFLVGKRPFQSPRALVYYGDGSGGFTLQGTMSTGLRAAELAAAGVADVDGDGNRDVIIAGLDGTSPFATVFRSDGDRTFSPGSSTLPPTSGGSIAIADFYGDGDPDVLITGGEEDGSRVSELFINNTNQPGPNRAPTVVQDLRPDTLAAGQTLTDTVEARDPDGDPVTLQASGATPNVSTTALDDATLEVQFAPRRVQAGRTPNLSVQADDARGASTTLSAAVRVSPFFARLPSSGLEDNSPRNGDAPTADVNGDGRTDVFVGATATLYLGQEDGTLQNANASLGPGDRNGVVAAAFGDVNNDGTPDLVKAFDDPDGDVVTTLYLGNGDGTFNEATGATLTGVENGAVAVADVNNDDNDDVLVTGDTDDSRVSETPSTTIYLSNGDGTFSTPGSSGLTDFVGDDIAVGAVDGDGNPDVLIVGGSSAELYFGNGDGTFQEDTPFDTFPAVDDGSATIADATGDGTADVLITGSEFGTPVTTLFVGNGDGTVSESSAGFPGIETGTAGVVDANGDGTPDVFVAGNASASEAVPQTQIYLGDGSGTFSVAGAGIEGVSFTPVAFGDFDGDGDEDLVLPSLNGLQAGPLYQNLAQERTPSTTVTKTISSGGTVDFGNTGAALTFSSVSSAGDVTVERFDSAPFTPSGISQSNVSEYRLVVEPSGGLRFSSVEVRLSASAFSGIDDPTAVQLYKRPTDGTSEFTGLQTSVEDQGTADISDDVIVASTSSLSEFVLASDTQPLPVELARFDATVDGASVRLTWRTASESGNAGFEVQRKAASGWRQVGYREGAGTTSQPRAYRFTDTDLPYEADRLAYRLKQVDTDGTASYSEEVTVRRGVDELTLLGTSPNPARRRATVRFAVPERQEVTVRLYDVLGRRVRTTVRRTAEGRQETRLDVGDLSSGVYFLRLRAGGEVRTQKLTVVR